jgi:hypothetical protein
VNDDPRFNFVTGEKQKTANNPRIIH